MTAWDIAEGHELCSSCRHPLELGERYSATATGEINGVPVSEPWCESCTRKAAA